MNILRVIASMNPEHGGPCQGIRNTVPELMQRGVAHEVLSLDAPDASFLGKDPFPIHTLGPGKTSWQYAPGLKPWLREHLKRFDAVIVHGLWQYHSYAVLSVIHALRSKGEKTPKVYVMPHGMLDPYFQKAPDRKLKALRNEIYWRLLEKNVINRCDAVLFTTGVELKEAATTFKGYHPRKAIHVGYGIPLSEELKDNQYNADGPLLFLSRIHPKKTVLELVKAYLSVLVNQVDLPDLVIAGPGMDTEYGAEIKALVQNHPQLASKVSFPGMLKGEAKWEAFKKAQLFVLPSHQENFGIAVAEALSASLPVLISDKVNIFEDILQDGAGIICSDEEKSIADALGQWALKTKAQKETMSHQAHECFKNRYTVEKAAENLIQLFKNN